jgi:hypothetical protein
MEENKKIVLEDLVGLNLEEDFSKFDLTEIQVVLNKLANTDAIDLSHAEFLQQQALRGADILTEYMGKIVKTVGYLESKVNSTKNKVSLDYSAPDGSRTTADMKKWAGESSKDVEDIQIKLAKAKASKLVLEKKYDILIKTHHHYKEIASGLRKTILGFNGNFSEKSEQIAEGYE